MKRLTPQAKKMTKAGFTLVELLVVLAIIALLLTVAMPRYFKGVDQAKESTLKHDLSTIRETIDKFYADQGRYPDSLDELVTMHYIRAVPADPITESKLTWVITEPTPPLKGNVYDIHSGADGQGKDGSRYSEW
jgi:general secretion pathway protein G